jgi:hypothetical protein
MTNVLSTCLVRKCINRLILYNSILFFQTGTAFAHELPGDRQNERILAFVTFNCTGE